MDLINLALMATSPMVVNEIVNVQVVATASDTQQRIFSTDLVFGWDPTVLEFVGIDNTGTLANTNLSFLATGTWDFYGINETMPPADGNGLYFWLSPLTGMPVYVQNTGNLLTTLKFRVLQPVATTVEIIPKLTVNAPATTVIYGSDIAGMPVTGTFTNAELSCKMGDFNCDGITGSADMGLLLSEWNNTAFTDSPLDLNGNGVVDAGDLSILLDNWG